MPSEDTMKALVLEKTAGPFKPGPSTYHPAPVVDLPSELLLPRQVPTRRDLLLVAARLTSCRCGFLQSPSQTMTKSS